MSTPAPVWSRWMVAGRSCQGPSVQELFITELEIVCDALLYSPVIISKLTRHKTGIGNKIGKFDGLENILKNDKRIHSLKW